MIILFFLVIDIVVSGFGLNQTSNLTSMDALQLFLTSTVIYTSNDGPWKGYQFPLSFMPSTSYIDGMCLTPAGICDLSSSNYQASVLQQRRLLLKYGLRIRDGAYWQLSLASMIKMEGKSSLLSLSTALDNLYSLGILSNKNTTENLRIQYAVYGNFEFVSSSSEYSWKNITTQNALLFQNIPTSSYLKDPISDPELVAGKSRPALAKLGSVRYLINDISMSDNVNALWIGPLQSLFLKGTSNGCYDYHSKAIQNAMRALTSFVALQTELGGITTPAMVSFGSKTKTIVSGSDNAFIFNGIKLLQTALNQIKTNKCVTSKENSLDTAIGLIDLILKGGYNVMNNATFPGLESFLTTSSILDGSSYFQIDPKNNTNWIKTQMATSVEIATNKLNMLLALISSSTISGVDAVSLWTSMKGELFVSLNQTYCIGLQASTPFVDSERTILAAMLSRSMQNLPGLDSATKAMLLQDQKSLESCIRSNLLMNVGESVAVLQSNRKGSWTFERSKQILDVVPSMGSTSLWFLYNKNLNPFMTQMTS